MCCDGYDEWTADMSLPAAGLIGHMGKGLGPGGKPGGGPLFGVCFFS